MKRRDFMRTSAIAGGGLLVSMTLPGTTPKKESWNPSIFIKILSNSNVRFISTEMEIGQGTTTGLAQVVAEELGADWGKMEVVLANGDTDKFGLWTGTGGSNGIGENWLPLRKAAAAIKEVLIKVAAERWQLPLAECETALSQVVHRPSGKSIAFGDLTTEAAQLDLPENPKLKSRSEFNLIGKSLSGNRLEDIVSGKTAYSIDVSIPNMVYATIERTPTFRGKVKSFDDSEARKVKGVLEIYAYEGTRQESSNGYFGGARAGVVVIANSTWAALKARKQLKIAWDSGRLSDSNVGDTIDEQAENAKTTDRVTFTIGNPDDHLKNVGEVYAYTNGLQVNLCMEPLNAVAQVSSDKAEIWVGTQAPQLEQTRISQLLDFPLENVTINTQASGGGFGRRFFTDYTEEAVLISKRMKRAVKLMWTREDTIKTNRLHHARYEQWSGILNDKNQLLFADYKGIVSSPNPYQPLPYAIPHLKVSRINPRRSINGHVSWRSVYAHYWIWGLESFMDEMAFEAKTDPLKFRLMHLNDTTVIKQKDAGAREELYPGRLMKCLELAGEKLSWEQKTKKGTGKGIAGCSYNTSYCALAAEVTVINGDFSIDKIVVAIDCGLAINPGQIKGQIEGSVIWALSAMFAEIEIVNGLVQQSNYHDYPILRSGEVPTIEIHIIENDFAPSGVGEPAVPVTAPAIANAIFAATGKRLRSMPLDLDQLK